MWSKDCLHPIFFNGSLKRTFTQIKKHLKLTGQWHGIRLHKESEKSGHLRRWEPLSFFCSINGKSMDYHLQVFLLPFVNLNPLTRERIMCKWLLHPARIHLKAVICQTGWNLVFLHERKYWYLYCYIWLPHPVTAEQPHCVQTAKPTKWKSHHPKLQQMKITDFSQTQWLAGQLAIAIWRLIH